MIKRLLLFSVFFLIALVLWNWELVDYGVSQALGQLRIIFHARPIAEVLSDPDVPDSVKNKLNLIQEIRDFAIDSLAINDSGNYQTFYDQKGKDVLWVVTASPPFSLEPKTWDFPLLGSFSYRGYFDFDRALAAKKQLENQGLDCGVRSVTAWSTLGWFSDPILSKMLTRGTGDLANLVIHELTHATLFIKDSVTFNENLASFVGDKGARKFLVHKYGENSAEYLQYVQSMADQERYTGHSLRGARLLDSLYQSFSDRWTEEEKRKRKNQLISTVMANLDTIGFNHPEKYRAIKSGSIPNNTYFLSFTRYESILPLLEDEFRVKFGSDLARYLDYLKKTYPSL